MSECHELKERFPELLVESLEGPEREQAFRHVESCEPCGREWASIRETWDMLGAVPDLPVPAGVVSRFEDTIRQMQQERNPKLVPFRRPAWQTWAAQAAGVVLLVGAAYFAGAQAQRDPVDVYEPASLTSVQPIAQLSEQMIVPASQLTPGIQGRPDIRNVNFFTESGEIGVKFDITSSVTVTGQPNDESLVELISYVLQNGDNPTHSRSEVIQWVQDTYATSRAEPELVTALANVLSNDTHEGVRIKAVDALRSLPASSASGAREALIQALRNDPNPAVRMKAVDALANLVAEGGRLDSDTVEILRSKADQDDENLYVRVKAAEALSQISL
ncbi:MAG: HEAT repeat domain-containing protein [Acidobacteria bacterium]|nr:HEAT repeat domain-containing protein [Acidobacteriota bacterium]